MNYLGDNGRKNYPAISITLPNKVLEIVDEFREENFIKRSPAIARIILEWNEMKKKAAEEEIEERGEG